MAQMRRPHVVRWGVLGTGWISSHFVQDLGLDTSTRGVDDVSHALVAVASRALSKAQAFIDEHAPEGTCAQKAGLVKELPQAVGSYDELVQRADVDCVYVGTPHPQHYENARLAIEAGKNVLLEKPATLNAAEWSDLVRRARAKDVFLMEAVWTRFFPLSYKVQELLFNERVIGDLSAVFADLSMSRYRSLPDTDRMFAPELAGGVQLDCGPYPLVWAMMALFHHPDNHRTPPTGVTGSMLRHPRTSVDVASSLTLNFEPLMARANLTCSFVAATPSDVCVRIIGDKGELVIPKATMRPEAIVIRRRNGEARFGFPTFDEERIDFPEILGLGLYWEADAVARSLRDGEKENRRLPHDETLLTMQLFDEWRKQAGYKYLDGLEKLR